jgi:RNA polymerase sigma-70 factor (ECF subfamily)
VSDPLRSAVDFEEHRTHLESVAYRMLGSFADADDAVQETWLRLARSDTDDVQNMRGWLTTVVARVCLDMLRTRARRREESLEIHLPDPVVTSIDADPERNAELADSVELALLVVLDSLSPNERLAFVLHDVFAVPFEQIGSILDRSPAAAKQLASRARRRVRGAPSSPVADRAVSAAERARQRAIVDAFRAAARAGDLAGLIAVLDPDVVLRADAGSSSLGPSHVLHGAEQVAAQAARFAPLARFARPVLVNGAPGLVAMRDGVVLSLLCPTIRGDRIVELDIYADPDRLRDLIPSF